MKQNTTPELNEDFYEKWQESFLKGKKHVVNNVGFTLY